MIFWEIFTNSIKLPNKKAMRRLNQIGMDYTVFYMFFLLLVASLPSFIEQALASSGASSEISFFFFILFFFMFFYLPFVLIIFAFLSLLAYIAVLVARILKRRLTFAFLWKLIAYSTTIPFLLYTAIALLYDFSIIYLGLTAIYSFTIIMIIISSFPRRPTS